MSNRRGCWFAIARCFNSKPNDGGERTLYEKKASNVIEFENLVTADQRALEARKRAQLVTDTEREHVMSGNLEQLIEEQRRLDNERDAELRRQEEALKAEEEAYYAAKREAAKRTKSPQVVPVTIEPEQTSAVTDQSDITFHFPSHISTSYSPSGYAVVSGPSTSSHVISGGSHGNDSTTTTTAVSRTENVQAGTSEHETKTKKVYSGPLQDDADFDLFLDSIKSRQATMTTNTPVSVHTAISDSEEEIDFGYWEKAPLPATTTTTSSNSPPPHQNRTDGYKEVDLNLL